MSGLWRTDSCGGAAGLRGGRQSSLAFRKTTGLEECHQADHHDPLEQEQVHINLNHQVKGDAQHGCKSSGVRQPEQKW